MSELKKIREMSTQYGISARALKYYEEMGLITSTRNDDYAYRLYDEAAVQRLEQILILRKLNISIKDIKRIFNTSGSEVVLEVLGKKVDAIDEEVSLLHELKEIVLDFIRQIEQSDFGNESDIKLLYEKTREIEAQFVNVDYNGNITNANRLLDVTDKLARTPEIIHKRSYCYLIFNLKDGKSVIEASELYCKAFDAEKTSEDTSAGEWIDGWIGINIRVFNFGIFIQAVDMPGNRGACCISFATEQELRKAYELLSKDAKESNLHLDWHWTSLAATITDKFGVDWLFALN
ncbi:MAG: MerR family transcriptional regulator [Oscillospiraceae bacterium]|nr:MerR family transcriptional regulator [Oscillospiraceae bacterium]